MILAAMALATTREEVLDAAAAFSLHTWTATAENETAECSSDYASDYPPGTYMGLPYDWGGYMTVPEFDAGIAAGDGAGSHSWHGILECTVGLDCSGFVSQVWQVDHYTTSTFEEIAVPIEVGDLERGDALNDPGSHMVLFTHLSESGWPVFYEASGGADRVHLNSEGGWSYVSGYQPIRLTALTDGADRGTPTQPIPVEEVPYTDYRWTAGAATDDIDSYRCAPEVNESGPEVYYRFDAPAEGWIAARVSDDIEVDVDVHILSGPRGEDCLARGDTQAETPVGAGEVWIVVDSYVGSREFPGPFILTIAFSEEGPPEDTAVTSPQDSGEEPAPSAVGGGGRESPRANSFVPRADPAGCGCGLLSGAGWGSGLPALLAGLLARRRVARGLRSRAFPAAPG